MQMKIKMKAFCLTIMLSLIVGLIAAPQAFACSVCQGDPDSSMVQGAKAGVILMVSVTYALLLCFGGTMAVWFVRARKLAGPKKPATPQKETVE